MYILKEGTTGWDGTDQATADAIKAALKGQGIAVRTKEEDTAFVQTQIDEAFGRRNTEIETTIQEVTGIQKNNGEKYYDFLKRAVSTKTTEITTLKAKIAELERAKPDSEQVRELKEQLETVKAAKETAERAASEELHKVRASAFSDRVDKVLEDAIGKLRPTWKKMSEDSTENEELIRDLIKIRKQKFLEEHTPHDSEGVIVFKGKDGKIIRNTTAGHPEGVDVLIKPLFETMINKGHAQGGTGSGDQGAAGAGAGGQGSGGAGAGAGKDWTKTKRPDGVKSQRSLMDHLRKVEKLEPNTEEFDKAYAALNKDETGKPLPFQEPT